DLDDLLHPRRGDDLLDDDPLVPAEHRLDRLADLADLDAQVVQNLGRQTLSFPQQPKQEMFRTDVAVVRPLGLFLRERQNLFSSLGEPLERIQIRLPPAGLVGRVGHLLNPGSRASGQVLATYYNARSQPAIST